MVTYEVQGRRAANGVRLATEKSITVALVRAGEMTDAGFTAWVFEVRRLERGKRYRLLRTLQPERADD